MFWRSAGRAGTFATMNRIPVWKLALVGAVAGWKIGRRAMEASVPQKRRTRFVYFGAALMFAGLGGAVALSGPLKQLLIEVQVEVFSQMWAKAFPRR